MSSSKILIIDDHKSVLVALEMLLLDEYDEVITLSNPNGLMHALTTNDIELVILDMNFSAGINNGNEGLYWLDQIHDHDPALPIILLTAYGDVELAVSAIKRGAVDFVLKPWDNDKLMATVRTAIELGQSKRKISQLESQTKGLTEQLNGLSQEMIGRSPSMLALNRMISKVAHTDANIMIMGENGTGKELIAREIHRLSKRRSQVMVSVDMGAIAPTLFESELFGHCKGAFTDAREDRAGRFELASSGTLFLDEIGNLTLPMQAKLLSVLQTRKVSRVGDNEIRDVDIRLICATNKNLKQMVADGSFREDLLYRINTIVVDVPALRDREGDIALLAQYYLHKYARKYNKPLLLLSEEAVEKLNKHHWPGNVRELQHTMERAVILSDDNNLSADLFSFEARSEMAYDTSMRSFEEMERIMIIRAVERFCGNMSAAAKELGVTRATLYNKMKRYDL